jgi:peptidoglycan/LPS O-acetylase OafA/YrhL
MGHTKGVSSQVLPPIQTTSAETDNPGGFRHIPALDGLRGTAILLILYDHLFWSNPQSGNRFFDFMNEVRDSSWVGVNLFFALSGFLITGILFETLNHKEYFKVFYARRALRIFPLYYGFLFLILVLTKPLHFHWNGWQYYYLTYTNNLALWRYHVPLVLPYFNINHFWSLDVEEQFYLVWPFVLHRVKSATSLIKISLATCLVVLSIRTTLVLLRGHFTNPYLVYSPTFSCTDNLLFGCSLALVLRTGWRQRILRLAPRVFAACAAFVLLLFFMNHGLTLQSNLVASIGISAIGIMATSLIAITLRTGSISESIFSNPVLRFFGRYSYGLYIYHYSIDGNVASLLRPWFANHFHSKAIGVVAAATVSALVSIVVALISYHLFEVQILKLKKYFSYTGCGLP